MVDLQRLDICFIAGTLGQGGAERQLFYMLRALCEAGARPRLLCLTRGEHWERPIRDLGVPITWVGQSEPPPQRLLAIVRILRASPPALIQSAHFYTNVYAALAGMALGVRAIGALRSDSVSELRANGRLGGRLCLHLPRTVVANSMLGVRNARALGVPERRLRFLANVVDCRYFAPPARRREPTLTVLFVGRIEQQKRPDRFVRVIARLRDRGCQSFRAIVVGAGPLRAQVEAQARAAGLLPEILELRGVVADTRALYHEADVLVLTSDWEGTPNVVLEAMACGLPVVATRVGGVPDIVRDGETGYLVDPDDEDMLEERLRLLLGDVDARVSMGLRGRSYVDTHHAPERLAERLAGIYTEAFDDTRNLALRSR